MSLLWRKDDPVLSEEGAVVTGGMFEHQRKWWDSENFVKALVTGYGGGKTFVGAKRAIAVALHNAPAPFFAVSPTYKLARRTTIPTLKQLLSGKEALLPNFKWRFLKQESEFQISYRGRNALIWIGSGEDPDSLRGPNIGAAWIDEPFIQASEVLDQILARVRDPNARQKEINLTGTPEQLNWGYDICEGDRAGDFDLALIQASTRDNKVTDFDSSYSNRLESAYTEKAAQAYIEGRFVNLQTGTVYYGFDDENIQKIDDPGHELFVGMDFNVDPMAACVFWRNGDRVHIADEIELPNADTEYMCQYLKDQYQFEDGKCRVQMIYPDASGRSRSTKSPGGKSDFNFIEESGFYWSAKPANPAIRDRENAVNGMFKAKDGVRRLTVSPKCKKLIGYLRKYTHEGKNKQKQMSHLIDALGYPIAYEFPVTRRASGFSIVAH